MAEKTWATIEEVATITGAAVDAATIGQAQAAIETISGVVVDADAWPKLNARDRRWLRNAAAYQAAFMVAAADYFERQRVSSASQDGQSASFLTDSHELAPLARKALRKLSWKGTRVVQLASAAPLVDLDAVDDRHEWRPL